MKEIIRSISNYHKQGSKPNIFYFSTPRSGSTWLMELILSQNGIKQCNEPFNIRRPEIRKVLDIHDWDTLQSETSINKIKNYIDLFTTGSKKVAFADILPQQKYHRFVTNRIIFKILFAGEDRINWFKETFDGKIIFSIRHPIPVSLSREVYPRLQSFITSDYRKNFTEEQISFAKEIIEKGTELEKMVLDWCFQNAPPLRNPPEDLVIITYEQLTLDPGPIITKLANYLELEDTEEMLKGISKPSNSVSKSNEETASFLGDASNYENNKKWLIEKWRKKVDVEQEKALMNILKVFELDIYNFGDYLPNKKYWIS